MSPSANQADSSAIEALRADGPHPEYRGEDVVHGTKDDSQTPVRAKCESPSFQTSMET